MQLSHVLYFDIKVIFWVTSAAFVSCLFDLLLFLFSNHRSYARCDILFGFGLACFSASGDSTASLVRI